MTKATGSFRKRSVYQTFMNIYENSCGYCGVSFTTTRTTLDHFIPASKDGGSRYTNFVPACDDCNHDKDNQDAVEWMKEKNFNILGLFHKMSRVYNIQFETARTQFFNCRPGAYSPQSFFWKHLDTQWKWMEYTMQYVPLDAWKALHE